ncbi:MAG: hypothetical protein ACYDHO_06735 [Gaiellaceae bacterium]
MNDGSIDEQLREKAEREGRHEPERSGLEFKRFVFEKTPIVRQPLTMLMIATTTALDLLGLVVMLKVNLVAGLVVFFASSTVLAIWLLSRIRAIASEERR